MVVGSYSEVYFIWVEPFSAWKWALIDSFFASLSYWIVGARAAFAEPCCL